MAGSDVDGKENMEEEGSEEEESEEECMIEQDPSENLDGARAAVEAESASSGAAAPRR